MKNTVIVLAIGIIIFTLAGFVAPTPKPVGEEKIQWYTFQEAVELNKKNPKKIIVDVYTNWCGWCKVMDAKTFTDPVIIKNINKYFYAVKLNAEMKDTIVFNNYTFVNPSPATRGSTHQLAAALLNNKMSYPTTVFLDEGLNMLSPVAGYLKPENIEPILVFYGENHHTNTKWEDYSKKFKGEVKPQ